MKHIPQWTCHSSPQNTSGLVLNLPTTLFCGGMAGAIAQSFSYPMDVIRRRMQLANVTPETAGSRSLGMIETLKNIYREDGIVRGVYRGMSINYLRAIPMVSASFTTYELMKQLLNLDTGMKLK